MTETSCASGVELDPPSSDALVAYRAAVTRLSGRAGAQGAVRRVAEEPEVRSVLDALPTGADAALARIEAEVDAFRPTPRSNVATPADQARLLFLQQIDVLWWSSGRAPTPFLDDDMVLRSPGLVRLDRSSANFRYRVSTRSWPVRARNHAVRRWAPGHEPHSSGLSYDRARPAMIALLNDVSTRFTARAPEWRRGVWVNCLVRSEAVQTRLRELGYSAAPTSSHCVGWAADVEMTWLAHHGYADPLRRVLRELAEIGTINLIDEGQAWHVCLNPAWVGHYEARFSGETACAG